MSRLLPHVVQISFFNDRQQRSPVQLLEAWPTLVDVAEAASHCGVRVSVVQACAHEERLQRSGVSYYFLPLGDPYSTTRTNGALSELLRELVPDIFHVHGLEFPRDVLSLAALAPGVPVVVQDHASRPPRIWRRALWRRALSAARGIAFCAREQAAPFDRAGLLGPATQVFEIPESTSRFTPGEKEESRRALGVGGDPLVLWVGHLNENKDPLTVLAGISEAVRTLPGLQLWCCFGVAPLLREVQARIAADGVLRERVHLLGRVPHERVEELMRAADIFVLGSHREGSGYSLIEALACGLPPVVTDIPSFRSLTGHGKVGKLWACGDSHALCEALLSTAGREHSSLRAEARAHFERELSFEALGSKLAAMYESLLGYSHGNLPVRSGATAAIRAP